MISNGAQTIRVPNDATASSMSDPKRLDASSTAPSAPANVRVERWVPQEEALAQASLIVCHGGSGTVLGALAAELPLIILPLFADQFANARALEAAGAARVVAPEQLRAAILSPPHPATHLARELRAAPPPLTALRRAP